jgi:hypothetical protein
MGCSFDRLGATIHRKKDIKTFVEIYNRELADQLYWGEDDFLSEDDFENIGNGIYCMSVEQEPLFKMMENGAPYEDMIMTYLEAVPDAKFSAWYECTFNNCGDIVSHIYDYNDGELKIERRYADNAYLDYCPECDWEAYEDENFENDALCLLEDYDPDEEYRCPNCGEIIEWEVDIIHETMKLADGKWFDEDGEEVGCASDDDFDNEDDEDDESDED